MLAVGIWAAQLRGHAIWLLPMAFVGVMSLGGLAGAAGLNIPSVEGIILLSCAVFSLLITRRMRFSNKVNVLIVAFFAFFHGFAHGHEISTSASLISYTLGFMLATLLLHGAGILVAKLVILTLAFMFSTMFSATALAKVSLTLNQSSQASSSVHLLPQAAAGDLVYGQFASNHIDGLLAYHDLSPNVSEQVKVDEPRVAASRLNFQTNAPIDVRGNRHPGAILPMSDFYAVLDRVLVWFAEDSQPLSWAFKRHFPQINHTPGNRLLSNGAGLTSPPQATLHDPIPSQVALSLRPTPIPDLEAHTLRSNPAQRLVGILNYDYALYRHYRATIRRLAPRLDLLFLGQSPLSPLAPYPLTSSNSLRWSSPNSTLIIIQPPSCCLLLPVGVGQDERIKTGLG
jgi:urease accessory protein